MTRFILCAMFGAALSVLSPATSQAQDLGCYVDSGDPNGITDRTLAGVAYIIRDAPMTNNDCQNYCNGNGYTYSGTEYGHQCFCSNSIRPDRAKVPDSECNMACSDNKNETCGGTWRISIRKGVRQPRDFIQSFGNCRAQDGVSYPSWSGYDSLTYKECSYLCLGNPDCQGYSTQREGQYCETFGRNMKNPPSTTSTNNIVIVGGSTGTANLDAYLCQMKTSLNH